LLDKEEWKEVVENWFEKYEKQEAKAVDTLKNEKKFWNFKAKDDKTGELTLYGEIASSTWWGDETTPKQFKEDLDALGDIETLNVYVNSPGGDVFAGQTIYSILKRCDAQVNVYVDGLAASIASLITMAGDTVIMSENAMMMVHNPWTIVAGEASELRKMADTLDKVRDSMVVAYESRSALTAEEIVELLDAETWLSAAECEEYGFCDEIEDAKEVAACIDERYFERYRNAPKELLKKPEEVDEARELEKQKLAIELELCK